MRALCSPASGVPPGWQFSIPCAGIWHQMESLGREAAEAPSLLSSSLEWQVVGMAHGSHLGPGWGRAACFRLTVAFGALTRKLAHSLRWGSLNAPPASSVETVTPTRPPQASVPTSQRCPGLIGRSAFLWMLRGALCPLFWGSPCSQLPS